MEEQIAALTALAAATEDALAKLREAQGGGEKSAAPDPASSKNMSSTWERKNDGRDDIRELMALTVPSRAAVAELVFIGCLPADGQVGSLQPARLVVVQNAGNTEVTLVPLVPGGPLQKFDLSDIVSISQPPHLKLAVDLKLEGHDPLRIAMAEEPSVGALLAALSAPFRLLPGEVIDDGGSQDPETR